MLKYKMKGWKMEQLLINRLEEYIDNQDDLLQTRELLEYLSKSNETQTLLKNLEIAKILSEIQVDTTIIEVALLRDLTFDDEFMEQISEEHRLLLSYADKMKDIEHIDTKENDYEDYRNVIVILAKDYRIIILELATRLYQMRADKKANYPTKAEFAKETLHIYCPIAHRLGLRNLKTELEELSLYFIDHEIFMKIVRELELKKNEREELVQQMLGELKALVSDVGDNLTIFGRSKSIYSIYNKTYARGKTLDDIYDLQAIRIICDTKLQCYTILGLIHEKYRPIAGRFKDYIAMKKPNLYQSLHTTVFGSGNQIYEIQIRTYEMDEIAERGIAAHWLYKEQTQHNSNLNDVEEQLHLFRDIIQDNSTISENQIEEIQNNVFESSIYTLTPNGKIINLPKQATVIDFAYRIHSRIAEQMNGATVNGKIVSYDYELKNGDVVSIRTQKNFEAPNPEWLDFAKTTHARRKIRSFLKKKRDAEISDEINRGKELMVNALKKADLAPELVEDEATLQKIISKLSMRRTNELFYELALKRLNPKIIIDIINEKAEIKINTSIKGNSKHDEAVLIEGGQAIARQLAKCCEPVYGDEIIGVIASGVGIKIHRKECLNIKSNHQLKTIAVKWNDNDQKTIYSTELVVHAEDRPNFLQEAILVLNKQNVGIDNFSSRVVGHDIKMKLNLSVHSTDDIERVIINLKKIRSVIAVERILK